MYPYTFNVHELEPRTGRLHLLPPTHQTFQGPSFVICSFCPREPDYDPAAVPLPYHHSSVHSEEIIELDDPSYAYSWRTGEPAPVAQSTTG